METKIMQSSNSSSANKSIYADRLDQLYEMGRDDGIEINPQSEQDFREFACTETPTKLASLVLLSGGNLRALWEDDFGQEIYVQFYGNGEIQYLISQESEKDRTVLEAWQGDFGDLLDAIESKGLGHLLYEK